MRISARIAYGALCKQLGVDAISGVTAVEDSPEPNQVLITLRSVTVDDDDARGELIARDMWNDEPEEADDPDALRDFVAALLAGDVGLARIVGDRLFASERMRRVCEDALLSPATRRAA